MTKTHTSNVDEAADPVTAPSKQSAKQTPPATETKTKEEAAPELGAILTNMTDFELVQLSLVAMALLHKRAVELDTKEEA